jgi:thiamine biosynthesis lipoprotein
MRVVSRRRFISLSAAVAGLALLPRDAAHAEGELVTWRGQALGAVCTLQIHHRDRAAADALLRRMVAEARRLERIFSLYDPSSTLVALNRGGALDEPSPELVALLGESLRIGALTGGAFDVTVQPLWALYLAHFSTPGADLAGPPDAQVREALARVDQRRLVVGPDRIVLPHGMAVTLNGIAQGFVTDRLVDLLRTEGVDRSLVDMGEPRVIGLHPEGRSWEVGIADPRGGPPLAVVPLVDRAMATSAPSGFRFDAPGRFNHLFQPSDGRCAWRYASVSVVAETATLADGLSTAFSMMPEDAIRTTAAGANLDLVYVRGTDGSSLTIWGQGSGHLSP